MNTPTIAEAGGIAQDPARASLMEYFRRCRADAIRRYAEIGSAGPHLRRAVRADMRSKTMHFARLIRKMEGRT